MGRRRRRLEKEMISFGGGGGLSGAGVYGNGKPMIIFKKNIFFRTPIRWGEWRSFEYTNIGDYFSFFFTPPPLSNDGDSSNDVYTYICAVFFFDDMIA